MSQRIDPDREAMDQEGMNAMLRMIQPPSPHLKGNPMSQEALLAATKTALDQIAEIVAPGEDITDLNVLVDRVRDRQAELNLIAYDLIHEPTACHPAKFKVVALLRAYQSALK